MNLTPRMPGARLLTVKAMRALGVNKMMHRVYYNYVHGFDTANKYVLPALDRCFELLDDARSPGAGDYMEFGVFKGYCLWHAQKVARRRQMSAMRFFGFDSFAGLPAPQGIDATAAEDFYQGQYSCSKAVVERNLDANGVDWDRTFLIEGFFRDSLTAETRERYGMKRVALALIDCDLYESTSQVLEFLAPLVDEGTILMLDDWNAFDADDHKGQRRAFREFLATCEQLSAKPCFSYGHYGQVFTLTAGGQDQGSKRT
jgi:O-methyltransferase